MYKYIKTAFITGILLGTVVISTKPVLAGGDSYGQGGECVPVYGGGVQCPRAGQVLIDKTVLNPSTGIFVDNLGPSDPKYRTQQEVAFRLVVKNSGDKNLETIEVKDTLPPYVVFMSGPGSYDANSRVLTFTVNNLGGGASQTFEIKARTEHPAVFPADKNVVCPVNVADAQIGEQKDHDEAQFCIEKKMEVPSQPKAGSEVFSLVSLTGSLITGLYLKKKTSV